MTLVPTPEDLRLLDDEPFRLTPAVRVVVDPEPGAVAVAVLVAHRIGRRCGFPVAVTHDDDGARGAILLDLVTGPDPALDGLAPELAAEAYTLHAGPDRVVIRAGTPAGLLRGASSLERLTDWEPRREATPALTALDHPVHAWRAVRLDLMRRVPAVDDVRLLVEVMTSLKLNVLHLRLADASGWRLALPGLPGLTSGRRHWTATDLAAVVEHASSRHVTVLLEVDLWSAPHSELPGVELSGAGALVPDLHDVVGGVCGMTRGAVHVGGRPPLGMAEEDHLALVRLVAAEVLAAGRTLVGGAALAQGAVPRGTVVEVTDPVETGALASAGFGVVLRLPPAPGAGGRTGTGAADPGPTALGVEVDLSAADPRVVDAELPRLQEAAELGWAGGRGAGQAPT